VRNPGYREGGGTFAPLFLASDKPMAMACLGLVTLRPLRPERSSPFFIAFISRSTDFEAPGLYFLAGFAADLRAVFLAGVFEAAFLADFFAAFLRVDFAAAFLAAGIVSPSNWEALASPEVSPPLEQESQLPAAGLLAGAGVEAASVLAGALFSEDEAAPSEADAAAGPSAEAGLAEGLAP
jgi:hypothetical protein